MFHAECRTIFVHKFIFDAIAFISFVEPVVYPRISSSSSSGISSKSIYTIFPAVSPSVLLARFCAGEFDSCRLLSFCSRSFIGPRVLLQIFGECLKCSKWIMIITLYRTSYLNQWLFHVAVGFEFHLLLK